MREVFRARIVLLAADGVQSRDIAEQLGTGPDTVSKWRRRFGQQRLSGLVDQPGRGRKPHYGREIIERIVGDTVHRKPEQATHWSTRTMAQHAGVSHTTVQRIWHAHELKPHLVRTFQLSNDKYFVEKLRDVIGFYLNPPEHALVLCVDEKSQIQALDRSQPGLPMKKGRAGTMTHDYKRHGTTTLFAALNVLEGTVIGKCYSRHRHTEYLRFLREIDHLTPKELDTPAIDSTRAVASPGVPGPGRPPNAGAARVIVIVRRFDGRPAGGADPRIVPPCRIPRRRRGRRGRRPRP